MSLSWSEIITPIIKRHGLGDKVYARQTVYLYVSRQVASTSDLNND